MIIFVFRRSVVSNFKRVALLTKKNLLSMATSYSVCFSPLVLKVYLQKVSSVIEQLIRLSWLENIKRLNPSASQVVSNLTRRPYCLLESIASNPFQIKTCQNSDRSETLSDLIRSKMKYMMKTSTQYIVIVQFKDRTEPANFNVHG